MTAPTTSLTSLFNPRFFIRTDEGIAKDIAEHVIKFEYTDDETKFDQLVLTVANPGFIFTNDTRLREGVKMTLRWGYLNDLSDPRSVIIAKARPSFPESGTMPTINLLAFDLRKEMNKDAKPTNWGAVSSSDVAKKIAARYGMDTDIEDSQDARVNHRVQPATVTDIQYLITLAQRLHWDCYVEGSTLHFHKKRLDQTPVLEFYYRVDRAGTLLSFTPDIDTTKPTGTKKTAIDPKTGKPVKAEGPRVLLDSRAATARGIIQGKLHGPHGAPGTGVQTGSPERDAKVLAAHANGQQLKLDMKAVKASMKIIGTPRVKARCIVRITGVAAIYCGNWRVKGTKHTIDAQGGYKVEAHLHRDGSKSTKDSSKKSVFDGIAPFTPRVLLDGASSRALGLTARKLLGR